MNIMTLPFALVVSVIAATTVFRNVFVSFDNFAGDSNPANNNSNPWSKQNTKASRIVFKNSMATSNGESSSSSDQSIKMDPIKSGASITVSRVVEVSVDEPRSNRDLEKGSSL